MNIRVIIRLLSIVALVIGGSMSLALAWAIFGATEHGEEDWKGILAAMGVSAVVGAVLFVSGRAPTGDALRREGIVAVGFAWFLAGLLGALPYVFTGMTFADGCFESLSGFTTTGSTVLPPEEIDRLPHGILFWRCFTQWMGGMGIVVLFVAILPFLRAGGKQLFFSEVPGPISETLHPRVRETALALWGIYTGISAVLVVILMVQDMTFFEAVCHACTTMSTGGFSTKGASIGEFNSLAIEITIFFFMVIAGINFGLYYRLLRGDCKIFFTDPELRFYIFLIVLCSGLMTVELWIRGGRPVDVAARHASFQVVSIMTTTGYGTDSFDVWPSFSKSLMIILMFVGGCAGSTAGGMKVIRILVLIKHALIETEHAFRPQTVRSLRVGKTVIEEHVRRTILAFFAIIMGTMVIGTLVMTALGLAPVAAMTSVATTLNNIGPGLDLVSTDFSEVPAAGKLFLALLMVVGRLEVFSVLALLSPVIWRGR